MLSSKLDLCKSEWLELVFDDRNTKYGAYDLRKHYAANLVKALTITCGAFAILLSATSYLMTRHSKAIDKPVVINLMPVAPPTTKAKPVDPPKASTPPVQHRSVAFPPPVVAEDNAAKNPPTLEEVTHATISQHNADGDDGGNIDIPPTTSGGGTAVTEDNTVHTIATIEVMPQFPGGEAAWAKFLQKNLRYPEQAKSDGVGGKVFISFVIEKDGHLTDFKVERGPGHGLDDEALRVMKLAPAWSPGIQNGQKVRVRYMMPFNFQLATDDN
jgi:protein TonB